MEGTQVKTMYIKFDQYFPSIGDKKEIIAHDGAEYLVEIIGLWDYDWLIENGQVAGVQITMEFEVIEETRPASQGKLRVVE